MAGMVHCDHRYSDLADNRGADRDFGVSHLQLLRMLCF